VLIPKLKLLYLEKENKPFPLKWTAALTMLIKKFKQETPVCFTVEFYFEKILLLTYNN
jgi:hypothetical protein